MNAVARSARSDAETSVDPRQEARKRKRDSLATWRPNRSTPCPEITLKLNSEPAQRVFHLAFVYAQQTLYYFYHTLPSGGRVNAVATTEIMIGKKFDELEKQLEQAIGRLRKVAEGIAAVKITSYSETVEYTVAMYTPEAMRFGKLMTLFDEIVSWLDALWFAGHINRKQRAEEIASHRNPMVKFARHLQILYIQARRAAKNAETARESAKQARMSHADAANDVEIALGELEHEGDGELDVSGAAAETIIAEAGKKKPATRKKATKSEPVAAVA